MRRPDNGHVEFGWQLTVSGRVLPIERRDQPTRSRISIDLGNRQLRDPRIRDAVQVIIAERADRPAPPRPQPHDKRPSAAGRGPPALRRNIPKPSPKHQQRKRAAQ